MNRTQRAVKRACHKSFSHVKREKHLALHARNEAHGFFDFRKKSEELKASVKNEKALKAWHRKMVEDYAANPLKEEKTA